MEIYCKVPVLGRFILKETKKPGESIFINTLYGGVIFAQTHYFRQQIQVPNYEYMSLSI